ncbi:SDR family NAD(P)-dependent oxidoreductase, partial [Burkholderia ubonensis]
AELARKLSAYLAGDAAIDALYRGQVRRGQDALAALKADEDLSATLDAWITKGKLAKLLDLWVQGLAIDWNRLYPDAKPRRVSLPTYPFARERHWVSAPDDAARVERMRGHLHPLLHENTSDLSRQRFSTRLTGDEFFLAGHEVQGRRVLPGVAYLEMAREALVRAAGLDADGGVRLTHVVWARPVVVDAAPLDVQIGLDVDEDGRVTYAVYSGEEDMLHGQGEAEALTAALERLDLAALRAQCDRSTLDGDACYAGFAALGLAYGPAFRAIERIHVGDGQALARLRLPPEAGATMAGFVLHPGMLDAALQASAGLAEPGRDARLALPFAIDAVDIVGRCAPAMWAWVVPHAGAAAPERVRKYDITLCDDDGVVCVRISGFASQAVEAATDHLTVLAPAWDVVKPVCAPGPVRGRVLIVGGTPAQQAALSRQCDDARVIGRAPLDAAADFAATLATLGNVDHLVWIAPDEALLDVTDPRLIAAQQAGVLACFRLVKALLGAGYGGRPLELTLLTTRTCAVHRHEPVRAAHASVRGLAGSLAKEYPNWSVRLVDLPEDDARPLDDVLRVPADAQGDGLAWRAGRWYRQRLLPARVAPDGAAPYRQGGVYVVIGGAGGLGETWSEHLIRRHAAQVVWIGRRACDAAIQARIDRLARLGPAPLYLAADATDAQQLGEAARTVRERFGAIHGVVHSALVLRDQSVANMDEARFVASLSAKVDVSVRMAQAFDGDALDFVLFFSSLQSFLKAAGQSNYAAGCTFKDAFAHELGRAWRCRVRVMNWGWWGGVGVVASEPYRERMAQQGIASIEPDEAMAALDTLLGGQAGQLALLKTTRRAARGDDTIEVFAPAYPSLLGALDRAAGRTPEPDGTAEGKRVDAAFQLLLGRLLCAQLQALGLAPDWQGPAAALAASLGVSDRYERWFAQTLRVLGEQGYLAYDDVTVSTRGMPLIDPDAAWREWGERRPAWHALPAFRAQAELVETTLRALPEILRGRVPATDVIFPAASMRLVENVYRHNPVADYFNAVLADAVEAFVAARLEQDADARIRILEIGAGTGGTSAGLFERLRPHAARIDEYCYSDVSKAFLFHAEQHYRAVAPYLRGALFDCGRPLAAQGLEAGRYDLVIATNVLHATGNIRHSVRNAKAALRPHGLLLLNEMNRGHVFMHLTFGLLDGWWLYEDPELRIAGSPALSAEHWRGVLEDEGFATVPHPLREQRELGQQIVVGESDGVVRQAATGDAGADALQEQAHAREHEPEPAARSAPRERPAVARAPARTSIPVPARARDRLRDKTATYLKGLLAKTLQLPAHAIAGNEPLEKYGIDSILAVDMTTALQRTFGNVSSTLLFEYRTLDELVAHFLATYPDALAQVLDLASDEGANANAATHGDAPPARVARETRTWPALSDARQTGRRSRLRPALRPAADASSPPRAAVREVAIVGMSGRYAQARNVDAFWANLRQGKHCIAEVPDARWDHRAYFDPERGKAGKTYSKWGGFIDGVDRFDPLFFNIAPREAEMMDPQERLFLEEAYASIEDAGHTPASLNARGKVGVFAGVMNSYYGVGTRFWSIANRVSYLFNFQGPSLAVDTACSSSLTALHLALESLRSGACDAAIVGGVNLILDPAQYVLLSTMNMLSAGDRCRSFGAEADGFVDGEGVGAVVLKPLDQAIEDGDRIYGVVTASALNHGGRTNGYTVPNPQAQAEVIARALRDAGIDARTLSYLEAHGTGTSLGDPIEIAGLSKA